MLIPVSNPTIAEIADQMILIRVCFLDCSILVIIKMFIDIKAIKTHDLISLDRWFDYFGAKNCTLLTLLIAESKPEEMEIMKQIVVSVLNKGENYAIY